MMKMKSDAINIQFLFLFIAPVLTAYPPGLRRALPISVNTITNVNFTCDSSNLNVTIDMEHPFKGLLFAKDFAQECKSIGTFSNTVELNLPTSGCGIRLSSSIDEDHKTTQLFYAVNLVIQQDRFLRQITDQEKVIQCPVNDEAFLVKSKALAKTLKNELTGGQINHRVGRMKDAGWSKELEGKQLEDELNEALSAARAWMEIVPEQSSDIIKPSGTLQVGETALLLVKSTLPAGIGWRVVDCVAHDGLGDSSQPLLDANGCPLDALLMPAPLYGPTRPIALMRHQEAASRFPAFKFPDRDRLHLACGLKLCKGPCIKIDCDSYSKENRTSRGLEIESIEEAEVLDRLEVFNSIEVLAPDLDDPRQSDKLQGEPSTYPFANIPGDRTFCVSPDKMAMAFCILGLIFLTAIVAAACSLLRSRRQCPSNSTPYYTRSLFSSSSGGSAFGSKLLLHDSSSPSLGHGSGNRLHYGRIL